MNRQDHTQHVIDAQSPATPYTVSRVLGEEVLPSSNAMTMLAKFDLLHLLQAVAAALRKEWDRELRAKIAELSGPRAAVIVQLGRSGGASQTRLARQLGLSQMTVSRLLDGLEHRGWVHREPMPTDRRAWAVRLTEDGKRVLLAIHATRLAYVNRICVALDEERTRILVATLAALEGGARSVPCPPN